MGNDGIRNSYFYFAIKNSRRDIEQRDEVTKEFSKGFGTHQSINYFTNHLNALNVSMF